jgi:hypothetical protein
MEEQSATDVLTVAGLLIACAGWYLRTKAVQRKKGQIRFALVPKEVAFGIFLAGFAMMVIGVALRP